MQPAFLSAAMPGAQRRLERADVEDRAARPARSELVQDAVGDLQRRCDHDEILIEGAVAPVEYATAGIGDRHDVALRRQEFAEPATHLAGAADDQRGASAATSAGSDTNALLRGQRAADQQAQHRLRRAQAKRPATRPRRVPATARRARAGNRASAGPSERFTSATWRLRACRSATSASSCRSSALRRSRSSSRVMRGRVPGCMQNST